MDSDAQHSGAVEHALSSAAVATYCPCSLGFCESLRPLVCSAPDFVVYTCKYIYMHVCVCVCVCVWVCVCVCVYIYIYI